MTRFVRTLIAVTALALCVACGASPEGDADAASCTGPYLTDRSPDGEYAEKTISPGASITVYGYGYTTTCNDTGQDDPLVPMEPVTLTLTLPGGTVQNLGIFEPAITPDGGMGFVAKVEVPAGTPPGTAEVRDDQDTPNRFTFQVGPTVPGNLDSGV